MAIFYPDTSGWLTEHFQFAYQFLLERSLPGAGVTIR